jgi:hypothetical protein
LVLVLIIIDVITLTHALAVMALAMCVQVGAQTETELKEKKLRVEDALNATKAAVEEGIIIGGGCTLLKLAAKVLVCVWRSTYAAWGDCLFQGGSAVERFQGFAQQDVVSIAHTCEGVVWWPAGRHSIALCSMAVPSCLAPPPLIMPNRTRTTQVDDYRATLTNEEQKLGADIIRKALSYPLRLIANNSGVNGSVVMQRVLDGQANPSFGFNAATGAFEDLMEAGIIDPTKVVRCALENSVSVAKTFLLADVVVTEIPEEEKAPAGAGAGEYGDY